MTDLTKLIADIKSGAVRLVPVAVLDPFIKAAEELPDLRITSEAHPEWERCMRRFVSVSGGLKVRNFRNLTDSPDLSASLAEMIEGLVGERDAANYEMKRLAEARAQSPDWEVLWAEQAERASHAEGQRAEIQAENEKLKAIVGLYREAVRVDVQMEGPKFMGSNVSALKRAWEADRAFTQEPSNG